MAKMSKDEQMQQIARLAIRSVKRLEAYHVGKPGCGDAMEAYFFEKQKLNAAVCKLPRSVVRDAMSDDLHIWSDFWILPEVEHFDVNVRYGTGAEMIAEIKRLRAIVSKIATPARAPA